MCVSGVILLPKPDAGSNMATDAWIMHTEAPEEFRKYHKNVLLAEKEKNVKI
ncbi:MAG: hypothetical protein ACLFUZ_02070 [Candidatus Micrarchaeia archaeon]